jgi:hypothetical protein
MKIFMVKTRFYIFSLLKISYVFSQTCASKNNESVPKRDLTKPKTTNARAIASAVDLFLTACGVPGAK